MCKRFRYADIHGIHAHVVAVVSTPAECKFAEVACTDDKSAQLVTQIHQYLRTFTGLCILVRHIVYSGIVPDVLEVLQYGSCNVYFINRNT